MKRSNAIIMNDLLFDESGIKNQIQQVLLPLYNCTSFFNSYAILDKFEPTEVREPISDNDLDIWILAKLYNTYETIQDNIF